MCVRAIQAWDGLKGPAEQHTASDFLCGGESERERKRGG